MRITKSLLLCSAAILLTACAGKAPKVNPAISPDKEIEQKVKKTLAGMSLEEKVGQMCQLTVDQVVRGKRGGGVEMIPEGLENVFAKYKLGSILNLPGGGTPTPATYSYFVREMNRYSLDNVGVTELYGVDMIHGASYVYGATMFPQEINQAASFNREIPHRIGQITAYETRAAMVPWVFAPVMDLGRQPLWSRMWESYGEDPFLNREMAVKAVTGLQGDDPNHIDGQHVAACLKHYLAYGVPVSGKDRTPSSVTDRELREKYFEPFRASIQAGALSLMVNSAMNNGLPVHANYQLLTQWAKEELGWDGMIVTDWADINNLCDRDHIAATHKDAIALAINAGIDMSMVPYDITFCDDLIALVKEGRVPMSRIDDAVSRILRLKYRLALMDESTWDKTPEQMAAEFPEFGSDRFAKEATEMAEEGIILLKNNGILPLQQGQKILVTGPNANNFNTQSGGWTYTWQGSESERYCREIGKYKTFYEAISNKFGAENVTYVQGLRYTGYSNDHEREGFVDIDAAVKAAQNVDVIIAVVGENCYCETPGNINDLAMSQNQRDLVKALAATGKPVVLVLNEGRPRIITDIDQLSAATVHTLLPSNYGGLALANLLAGDANFSAKLPFTYPMYSGSTSTYDYKPCESQGQMDGAYNYDARINVLYPFGHGLSYTTFEYSNLEIDKTSFTVSDKLTFTVDVTNTGKVAGKEAVLLYVTDMIASITPDNRRLRAFEKISLEPGETKTVTLTVDAKDMAFVGIDNHWILEEGDFTAAVGKLSVPFACTETYRWETPNRQ